MSRTSPVSRPSESGSSRPILILFLAVVMFASGAATSWWWFTQRVPPKVTVASVPAASAPPNFGPLTPSPVTASASASPSPSPSAAEPSPKTAEVAPPPVSLPSPRPRVARSPRVPPATTPPAATGPGAAPPAPPPPVGHGFVLGTTVVESMRSPGKDLSGFDTADVGVKRAPKVEGLIELVMDPPQVKAGESYAVKVFLKNQGRKPIDVGEMKVSVTVDGKTTTRPLPPKARQVPPMQRTLLEELPGVWRADVSDWTMEAVVTSKQQDVYRNTLTWK
jgi:hypothetical protein